MVDRINQAFPNLAASGYNVTSPEADEYNCIAWAADDVGNWWWPDQNDVCHWPESVPRKESLEAFIRAFKTLGYSLCLDDQLEPGFEKVAIFTDQEGEPTHAARQLSNGKWTSKLGPWEDIEHSLHGLTGTTYGTVTRILKRPK